MRFHTSALGLMGAAAVAIAVAGAAWAEQPQAEIASGLAREVSGVLTGEGGARLLLVEQGAVASTRTLAIGDEYRDGWMLASASAAEAVLTRRGERLRVALTGFTAPAEAESDGAAEGVRPARISLSNASDAPSIDDVRKSRDRATAAMGGGMALSPEMQARAEAELRAMSPQERALMNQVNERMASGEISPEVMMRVALADDNAVITSIDGHPPSPEEIAGLRAAMAFMPQLTPQQQAQADELSALTAQLDELRNTRLGQ